MAHMVECLPIRCHQKTKQKNKTEGPFIHVFSWFNTFLFCSLLSLNGVALDGG
jgi:hypothetical protein